MKRFSVILCLVWVWMALLAPAGAADINYRLKWLFNASVVGDLYADAHGYFKDQGLSVEVKSGGPERDAIRELELGYAQFGVASADQVIRALAKGANIVVLAQIFQINPMQWIYRDKDIQIRALADLKGKVLGITFGGNDESIMRALLAKGGIADDEVTFYSVRYDYTPFYRYKAQLWPVYRNSQGIIIQRKLTAAGESTAFLAPADFGVKFVANSVVTSAAMFKDQSGQVKRFMTALIKGWEQAMALQNQEKAIAVLRQFDKDTAPDMLQDQLEITRELIVPAAPRQIGDIDIDGWKQTEQIMLDQKLIERPVHVETVLITK